MFPWLDLLTRSIEPDRMLENIRRLAAVHRFAFTPGLKQVAAMLRQTLEEGGVQADIEYFPADRTTRFWAYPSKPLWNVEKAVLHRILPGGQKQELANYASCPLSVIQYSHPFAGELELAFVAESDFAGLGNPPNLENMLVLTDGRCDPAKKHLVDEGGASGIITYDIPPIHPVRGRKGLPDQRYQTVFNWTYTPGEKPCFGFVLSPNEGERLRAEILDRRHKNLPPLKAVVDLQAEIVDDVFPVLVGLIPGESQQEIVVVSHFCHPSPSANDNASGNAAALEIALTLSRLIQNGDLPKPQRTIRFLWVSEMSGPYAYLSHHADLPGQMVGGINLDMVGGDQCKNGSSLLIEHPSDACPSYAGHLLERLRREFFKDVPTHTGMDPYPLFRSASTGFAGASDHLIFCDPTVGVPMPMLHQYPDRFHHSTGDVAGNLDPAMLKRTAAIGAGFVTFLALAGAAELGWLASEIQTQFAEKITRRGQALLDRVCAGDAGCLTADEFDAVLDHLQRVYAAVLASLQRLDNGQAALNTPEPDLMPGLIRSLKARYRQWAPAGGTPPHPAAEWEKAAAAWVPVRKLRGPTPFFRLTSEWPEADRQSWSDLIGSRPVGGNTLPTLVEFWADGKRSGLEIAKCIARETGVYDPEMVVKTLQMLEKYQLAELRPV